MIVSRVQKNLEKSQQFGIKTVEIHVIKYIINFFCWSPLKKIDYDYYIMLNKLLT